MEDTMEEDFWCQQQSHCQPCPGTLSTPQILFLFQKISETPTRIHHKRVQIMETEKETASQFFGKTRFAILIIAHLCLTFAFSNSLIFNFTVICMDDVANGTSATAEWLNSPTEVNSLFSAIAIGCLIGTIPMTHFIQLWGIGRTCAAYCLFSGVATFFFPLAVSIGYPAVFLIRIIQGIPTALSYPATGQIASQWSTEKGGGAFIAILSSHIQFCSIFTMPVSGALCDSSWGWRGAFYLHGIVSTVVFLIFLFFYHDNPQRHRKVSSRELERISRGKNLDGEKRVPYIAILREPCVWGIWLSVIGGTLGFQVFLLYGPLYMNKVLGLDVASTGFATALPYVLSAIMKFLLGPLSDRLKFISQRTRCVCFAALSQGVMAFCFLIMSWTSSRSVAQIAYTAAIVFSGVNAVGTVKCAALVFRQHVHFVMSVASFILCFIVLLLPIAMAAVCPDNTPEEWSRLFWIIAIIVVLASTPFVFVARDTPIVYQVSPEKKKKRIQDLEEAKSPEFY